MYSYLPLKVADYAYVLDMESQASIQITGNKSQVVHEFDDNSIDVISEASESFFNVQLQWEKISQTDHDTIMDLWHDSAKANGMKNTFYWRHPIDGENYTVRFLTDLSSKHYSHNNPDIQTVTLAVEGKA